MMAWSLLAAGAAEAQDGPGVGAILPAVIRIPAGDFIRGSDDAEREAAYGLDEAAYGHDVTRRQRWYAGEFPRQTARTGVFVITATPITNRQYALFVAASGHRAPSMDAATWAGYGLAHDFETTRRFAWTTDPGNNPHPPAGREDHPVVLVSHDDARAYARWLSAVSGRQWRLPSEAEWEKAARGTDGSRFPWGDSFDPTRLNSHDAGPYDTVPVGQFVNGASPFGLLDGAGQVYEWTSTAAKSAGRFMVKGGSWDDKGCGVCRPAARHSRPAQLRHVIIGFRLVQSPPDSDR